MLKTAVIGKTINGATKVTRVMAISGDKIILVDATTGQAPKKVSTKIVDKDLHIFAEGATDPSVIVSDYVLYDQTVQISGLGSNGEYVSYGLTATNTMELGAVSAMPATASTPFMSSSAWWGVGILAIAGGAAAAGGGGGGGSSSSGGTTSTSTHAILVDSVLIGVDYYINNIKAGTTGLDGSFNYKIGDTVTFKVGAATLGVFTPTSTTSTVTISDLAGGDATKTKNLAEFLQTLDSDTNSASITISSTAASQITNAVNVQTDPTVGGQVTITVTNPDLSALTDHTPPSAAITLSDTVLNSGETATVTITFTEAVAGFSNANVTVANGTLSTLSTTDNTTWTATFTPTASFVAATNAISIANTYTDAAGNAGTFAISGNYTIDTKITPPPPITVAITDDEPATTANIAGGEIVYTFTFSEAVHGFSTNGITVTNGTAGVFKQLSSSVYTLSVVPNVINSGEVVVNVKAGSATNSIGTANEAAYTSYQAVDMVAPTVTSIVLTDTTPTSPLSNGALSYGETENVTVAFSEAVTNFDNTNVSLTGAQGTLGKLTSSDNIHWTGIFTPTANTGDSSNIIQVLNTYTDVAGNVGTLKDSDNFVIDTVASPIQITSGALTNDTTPTVTGTAQDGATITAVIAGVSHTATATGGVWSITPTVALLEGANSVSVTSTIGGITSSQVIQSLVVDTTAPTATITMEDIALKAGETSLVTIKFSEAVQNLTLSDFTAQNGTLTTLTTADNKTWTALFTPNANVDVTAQAISLATTYNDVSGNSATVIATSSNYTIDTQSAAPTFHLTTDDGVSAIDGITHTNGITVTLASDVASWQYSLDKGANWTTGTGTTFNLTPNTSYAVGDILVRQTDDAGNVSDITSNAQAMIVDTVAPTVIITDNKSGTTNGAVQFTFTFSEAVNGFTAEDITVGGGVKGTFSGSGSVYTLDVFSSTASTTNITVDIPATKLTDIAGNANILVPTYTQSVDTVAPTATITMKDYTYNAGGTITSSTDDYTLTVGDSATVAITFTEIPVGFDATADLIVSNGTLSNGKFDLVNDPSGKTYIATFTPTENITNAYNTIQLKADSYTDAAGNNGKGSISLNYTVDTVASPIQITSGALTNDTTPTVTGTAQDGATITAVIAGVSHTATATGGVWSITPTVALLEGANSVSVTSTIGGITSSQVIQSLVVDTTAPTATITMEDIALKAGETSLVTIKFSEAVQNLTLSDFTAQNGTLTTLTTADNKTWTALFTPNANVEDTTNTISLAATYNDVAGNSATVTVTSANYAIDTLAPSAPTFALTPDNGLSGTDGITHTNGVTVTLAAGITNWEYSLNGGGSWTTGTTVAGVSSFNLVENTSYAAGQIEVRQTDSNGNISTIATNTQTTIVDTIAAIPIIASVATNNVVDASENANLVISGTGEAGATVTLAVTNQTAIVDASGAWNIVVLDPATSFGQGSETLSVTQTDVAGNISLAGTHNIFIDTIKPTLDPLIGVKANIGSDSISITFSESLAPVDFANSSSFIVEINGTLYNATSPISSSQLISAVATTDKTVTLILDTSVHNINLGDTIRVGYIGVTGGAPTAIQDLIGNDAPSFGYVTATVENTDTPPVLTSMIADGVSGSNATHGNHLTLGFNETLNGASVTNPDTSDFVVKVNGVVDAVSGISITGSNIVLTLATEYTDKDLIEVVYKNVATLTNVVQDLNGIDALPFTYTITADTTSPTATIVVSDTALLAGQTSLVTITFSEAVKNFTLNDLIAESGTLSTLTSTDNITWTATFTPTTNITASNQTISLSTSYTDNVGNVGTVAISNAYTINIPPVVTSMVANGTNITLTFNEELNGSNTNLPALSDFTVKVNGVLDTVSGISITGSTVALTLTAPYSDKDLVEVTYKDNASTTNAIQDLVGNDALSFTYTSTADTVSPTAIITMSDTALTVGETSTVTIAFSEAVKGFSLADLTAQNGTLSALTTTDNITWTATFTPTTNITATAQTIALGTNYSDIVGNVGTTATSATYTIDTQAPHLQSSSVNVNTHQVTFNFDKALDPVNFAPTSMFYATDGSTEVLADPNHSLGHFAISSVAILNDATGGHATVTIDPSIKDTTTTPTPTPPVTAWTIVYNDAPGNDAQALQDIYGSDVSSFTQAFNLTDVASPTATITMADTALISGESSLVTIAFNERVANFDNADVTVQNGTLSTLTSGDYGVTWTGTFTPTTNVEDAINVITLANTYTDAMGNIGTIASSANYTISDTLAPTFTSMVARDSADTIVMTFSETLDTVNLPTLSDLLINVNGIDIAGAIASITASGTDLTLHMNPAEFVSGDAVKVTYTDPSTYNDVLAIQDLAGNDVLTFNNTVTAVL